MASQKPAQPTHVPPFVKYYNRFVRSFAGHRFYGLLRHRGRKSGKTFETPVMAWQTFSGMLVPLSWGPKTDWYQNIMAANGCDVQVEGRWYHCTEPVLIARDRALSLLPASTRTIARLFPVPQFVLLRQVMPMNTHS